MAKYKSAGGGASVPLVLDGTGLTTSVPLLIKNGKNLSGVELQVTGSTPTGYVINDSGGTRVGVFGLANAGNDFVANSAAGSVIIGGTAAVVIKSTAAAGTKILSSAGDGATTGGRVVLNDSAGTIVGYGTNTVTFDGTSTTFAVGQVKIPDSLQMTGAALATGATAGFFRIRLMAGTPSGAATNGDMVFDTTGVKFWVRTGGAWVSTVALT